MARLLLVGPPGAGKTVIANKLSEVLGIPFIKTGSLLRELPETDPSFEIIHEAMVKGELAPNDIVAEIVKSEANKNPQGFILDGWLRQKSDLEVYDPKIDTVIFLDCPKEVCQDRVLNRVVCKIHGASYSYSEQVCNLCKGLLEKRSDDTVETFNHRWSIYEELTLPVIEIYRNQNKVLAVDANKSIPEIMESILKGLNN